MLKILNKITFVVHVFTCSSLRAMNNSSYSEFGATYMLYNMYKYSWPEYENKKNLCNNLMLLTLFTVLTVLKMQCFTTVLTFE